MKGYFGGAFDSYTRVARVYPALISLAPVVWTIAAVEPTALTESTLRVVATAIVSLGGVALLTSLARSLGKRVEASLMLEWDGWPTTRLLRHRDATIDQFTKGRYHERLRTICPDLDLPSEAAELSDPRRADDVYRSAIARLLELRRGPEYRLLQGENAQYGFRRNLLGLKPAALLLLSISTLATTVAYRYSPKVGQTPSPLVAAWLADFGFVLVFALLIRKDFVRQAATEYALSLLRTLEWDAASNVNAGAVPRV